MTNEHTGFSRRKLLKAGAIGVPAAGVLAFGSTLVTATSANAISTDGWWGSETSTGLQRFMNAVKGANLVVDGVISSQPSSMAPKCPGIVGGWEWVSDEQAKGSPALLWMKKWLGSANWDKGNWTEQYLNMWPSVVAKKMSDLYTPVLTDGTIKALQAHYDISLGNMLVIPRNSGPAVEGPEFDGRLDGPSKTIQALQNEINQYV